MAVEFVGPHPRFRLDSEETVRHCFIGVGRCVCGEEGRGTWVGINYGRTLFECAACTARRAGILGLEPKQERRIARRKGQRGGRTGDRKRAAAATQVSAAHRVDAGRSNARAGRAGHSDGAESAHAAQDSYFELRQRRDEALARKAASR